MRLRVLVSFIIAIKLFCATISPLGYDFALYMSAVISGDQSVSWSPWIVLMSYIYSFWSWLPIEHGDLLRAITSSPDLLLPSHYLLTALVKTPLLISDVIAAFLVYTLGARLTNSKATGRKAALLWLMNPFVTLFVEMWGSIDVIIVTLSLASIVFAVTERRHFSAVALVSGIALRLSPIITWLALTTWVLRRKVGPMNLIPTVLAGPLGILAYFYWVSQGRLIYNFIDVLRSTSLFSLYTPVTQTFSEYLGAPLYQLYPSPGFAVMGVTTYYLITMEACAKDDWAPIDLTLSGFLLLYGLADWFPTAFLWSIPLLALNDSKRRSYQYSLAFFGLLSAYLLAFYNLELTSTSLSFLFIPANLVPFGRHLVSAVQSANVLRAQLQLELHVRSIFAGFSIAYAAYTTWNSLRKARA